jgi:hypothetical protein
MESSLLWYFILGVENDINEPTIKKPPQDDKKNLTLEEQIRLLYPKDIIIGKWRSIEDPIRKMGQYYDHPELWPSPKKFNRIN